MAATQRDPEGRAWLVTAICVLIAAACLLWLGSNPEPCQDPNTTACAVPYHGGR